MRLSQCMIVKNEERNIERALRWGKGVVWEQIVVDTGSTDRTVELAEKMGAKVFYFEWQDDLSAAKNFAISKASGDWIAFLDADEYFPLEETKKLIPLLERFDKKEYYAVMTSWLQVREDESIFAGGSQARLFKRTEGLAYRYRIHEELSFRGEGILPYTADATDLLAIYHTGYAGSDVYNKEKGERNIRLLLMELKEHPDNYHLMGYLGDSYLTGNESQKAKEWYYKAVNLMPEKLSRHDFISAMTFWKLMIILVEENDEKALLEIYEKAARLLPEESDFDFIVGRFYAQKSEFKKAAFHLKKSLSLLETHGNANCGMVVTGDLPGAWELLALCCYQTGDLGGCVKYCTALLKANPYIPSALVLLLRAFQREDGGGRENAEQVGAFLERLYNMDQLKDRLLLMRAAREAGDSRLEELIRKKCSGIELQCFDKAMEQHGKKAET